MNTKRTKQETKKEAIYHTAMTYAGVVHPGSIKAEETIKKALKEAGSFENIFLSTGNRLEDITDRSFRKAKERIEETDFQMLTIIDEEWPSSLQTKGMPGVLYYQGDIELAYQKTMAVVGTRNPTGYDLQLEKEIVQRLLAKGIVIVSGLAAGCDAAGHKAALDHGGKTIAVLGTPIDRYYPAQNRELQDRIRNEGLLISQYPIGIRVQRYFFSHRNRTIVGLSSEGVVVVKTEDHGGTQYAIKECLRQGKQLYALPGNLAEGITWARKKRRHLKIVRSNSGQKGEKP